MQVRDIDIAQEIVQEAFTRVWASKNTPSEEVEFRRWLYRVVSNLVKDYHRRQFRQRKPLYALVDVADPLAEVERRAGDPALLDALHSLSLREQQAIYLRYFEDQSFAETARVLGMPSVSVRVLVHRALARLRSRLAAAQAGEVAV